MILRHPHNAVSVCMMTFILLITTASTMAHDHVNTDGSVVSWYESGCCNNGDCAPASRIEMVPGGLYMMSEHGRSAVVPPEFPRRLSRDMRWHVCISPHTLQLLCVYEPPSM